MEKFIDREQELDTLQSEYERNEASLVILYGRRRVGKTTLISEFIQDKKALFFWQAKSPSRKTARNSKIKQRNSSTVTC